MPMHKVAGMVILQWLRLSAHVTDRQFVIQFMVCVWSSLAHSRVSLGWCSSQRTSARGLMEAVAQAATTLAWLITDWLLRPITALDLPGQYNTKTWSDAPELRTWSAGLAGRWWGNGGLFCRCISNSLWYALDTAENLSSLGIGHSRIGLRQMPYLSAAGLPCQAIIEISRISACDKTFRSCIGSPSTTAPEHPELVACLGASSTRQCKSLPPLRSGKVVLRCGYFAVAQRYVDVL